MAPQGLNVGVKPPSCSSSENEKKCTKAHQFYQSMFSDIPPISSRELIELNIKDNTTLILVDVRTRPEREISMIEGAISLKDFEQTVAPKLLLLNDEDDDADPFLSNTSTTNTLYIPAIRVVTYCTIGYRSGLEARRLRDKYDLQGHIYSLDGIVAYSHAVVANRKASEHQESSSGGATRALRIPPPRRIVRKEGGDNSEVAETFSVHTFGFVWNFAHQDYETTYFRFPMSLVRMTQVGGTVVVRKSQQIGFLLSSCCCKRKSSENDGEQKEYMKKQSFGKVH
jgi:rhodanese-related sulfurtransferase